VVQRNLMIAPAVASNSRWIPPEHVASTTLRNNRLTHAYSARAYRQEEENSFLAGLGKRLTRARKQRDRDKSCSYCGNAIC
jgi:hypothetical protein